MARSVLLLLTLISTSLAFEVTQKSPNSASKIKQGQSITLSARVDDYYEWCTFKSPDGKICDFEWKKPEWNVTVLNCDDFKGRFKYVGDYENYVCAVRITDVQGQEAGEWTVEIENYYNGYTRNYGYKANAKYTVEVEVPTTTTTTTTTPKPTTNIADYYSYEDEYDDETEPEAENGEKTETEGQTGGGNKRKRKQDSSMTYIILAILIAVFVIALIVVVALYFKRKLPDACYGKRWKPVEGNETMENAEDAAGNPDEDKEKHPTIVKNGGEGAKVDPAKDTATWTADEKEPLKAEA